jgi:uncharacterized protein YaaW (UPF0174 family)
LDELRKVLELATEEELQYLTNILFARRFNPLDYLKTPQPLDIQSQSWDDWLDSVESRFRYLAADGMTVLKGKTQQFSYRKALIQVCRYLKIPYGQKMTAIELETEIFLHFITKAWNKLPIQEKNTLTNRIVRSLSTIKSPVKIESDSLNLILKGSSVLAVNSVIKPLLLKYIAQEFALHFATYNTAKNAIAQGGIIATNQFKNYLTLATAKQGMGMTAARYAAVRTVFSFVGPILWGWFLADLGWKAISTNYGRIIPTILTLAQIRLLRGEIYEFA